jgi:hypothetical protein
VLRPPPRRQALPPPLLLLVLLLQLLLGCWCHHLLLHCLLQGQAE